MDEGLSWNEAHAISRDEMMLLLAQWEFRKEAEFLREEDNRLRFSMGGEKEINKARDNLERKRMALDRRFYRDN